MKTNTEAIFDTILSLTELQQVILLSDHISNDVLEQIAQMADDLSEKIATK